MTVDQEGDERRGQLHPPVQSKRSTTSARGEPTHVMLTRQQGPLLVRVAANALDRARRRSLQPVSARAHN